MIFTRKFQAPNTEGDSNLELLKWLHKEITNSSVLEQLILDYEYGKGKLQHIHIIPNTIILNNTTSGQFKAGYEINEYSLCAAIDYTATHTMVINFEIDKNTGEITLSGENRNERSDEF